MRQRAIVIQSAPEVHGAWIDQCMLTVEKWSALHDCTYRQIRDADFLGSVPGWVRSKCTAWINPVTDLARLLVAEQLLRDFHQVVWIDADVLIWAPSKLRPPLGADATFASERWMERWPDGSLRFRDNVANYFCAFRRGGTFLTRHIDDALEAIDTSPRPPKLGVAGTNLLTEGYHRGQFDLVLNVANISPVLAEAIARSSTSDLEAYEAGLTEPIAAANLCLSHFERSFQGKPAQPGLTRTLIDTLSELNRPAWPSEVAAAAATLTQRPGSSARDDQ